MTIDAQLDDGTVLDLEFFLHAFAAIEQYVPEPRPLIICKRDAPLLHAELTARPIPGYVLIDEWPRMPTTGDIK